MKRILLSLCFLLSIHARAGFVTLTAQGTNGTNGVAELTIGPYESAELVSIQTGNSMTRLDAIKDGMTVICDSTTAYPRPLVVAGPAVLRLTVPPNPSTPGHQAAICTFRVSPEAFPPDRTVIALPGTNQTSITLECSTNLVDWASATNGVYGPMPEAKFFRIKLQRQ